jgi:hypothetical protein
MLGIRRTTGSEGTTPDTFSHQMDKGFLPSLKSMRGG